MTIIFRTTAVVVFLAICGASTSRARGQQTSAARTQPIAVIKYGGDMASLLAHLPEAFGATIGFEVDPRKAKSYVTIDLRDPTLPDVLDAIVQSAGNYQWRESNGFIEVFPSERRNPLLDAVISNYRTKDVDESEALNQLMSLPEVQGSMSALSLHRRDFSRSSADTNKKFSLSLERVTIRQALNRIAAESGGGFWIFQTYGDGSFSLNTIPR